MNTPINSPDFTHLDSKGNPSMVDVAAKTSTHRVAKARAVVLLDGSILALLQDNEIKTRKGSVFQTAIIAGVMAAKRTSDLIPLCHPLGLENCQVEVHINAQNEVVIDCTASLTGKTGVEMEALVGASVAALTVYDMCKGLSPNIIIKETRLIEKKGGKSDFRLSE